VKFFRKKRRHRRIDRKERNRRTLLAVIILVAILGISLYIFENTKKNVYYGNYVPPTTNVDNNYTPTNFNSDIVLKLPMKIYGVVGHKINIYFDNVFLTKNLTNYEIQVDSLIGSQEKNYWTCTPTYEGEFKVKISAFLNSKLVASESTTLFIKLATAGAGKVRKCLFIGDSITEAGAYTQELLKLQAANGLKIQLQGTLGKYPNLLEGRAGWTLNQFYSDPDSPFVFQRKFDFEKYMRVHNFSGLNYVFINLGVNDVFGCSSDYSVNKVTAKYLSDLDEMVKSIHKYSSSIKVAVVITIPPNSSVAAFKNDYKKQTLTRYTRNNFIFASKLLDFSTSKEAMNIYAVPVNVNIDTYNGFYNAVHPNESGYKQIGQSIWYWLKSME